eukprot:11245454-Alexandrium_andersonii.AAC.1
MQFVNLHWEDGRAACVPRLDGFSWDQLGPSVKSPGVRSAPADADNPREMRSDLGRREKHVTLSLIHI